MDLDYLHRRQRVSLFMADNATTAAARRIHRELADAYASRIGEAKNAPPLAGVTLWNS